MARMRNSRFSVYLLLIFLICLTTSTSVRKIGANSNSDIIPISSGSFIKIYEQTGQKQEHTFLVSDVIQIGCHFTTQADEYYNITSDGTVLRIHCFRDRWLSDTAVGNNIVAVKLDNVQGFPDGLWASVIVSYILGYNGIAESKFNALGSDTQNGPYLDSPCTYLGDQNSELVLAFAPTPVTPVIKLSGIADYGLQEEINIKLAALVKDSKTVRPISDASVWIKIYCPNGTQWVSDVMIEKINGTGIYEWESSATIDQMKLEKGMYLVYAEVSVGNVLGDSDILLFHIDPPAESASLSIDYTLYAASFGIISAWAITIVALLKKRGNIR